MDMRAYIERTLEDHGLTDAATVPHLPSKVLHPGDVATWDANYSTMVGQIAWIATTSRPDISYTANMLQRATNRPTAQHKSTAIRVLKYLKATIDCGISYKRGADEVRLEGYVDAAFGD